MNSPTARPKNVFVMALEDLNRQVLEDLPGSDELRFHQLLTREELMDVEQVDIPASLAKAERILHAFDGDIDAIVGYWDFPISSLVPILCHRFDLPGPDLEGVLRCEHKYWSRQEQAEVIDEHPAFGLVAFDDPTPPADVPFPMWLKPVKSASSELAFRVEDEAELRDAVADIADGIDHFGRPFQALLDHVELPADIDEIGGRACLAEEAATGQQVTVEGYCLDDEPHLYGIVATELYPDSPAFHRYQYPADLPDDVAARIESLTGRVMRRMRLGSGTFNIEYFWDRDDDRLSLLEINPRVSQAHAELFEQVDGASNLQALVRLGLGRDPAMPHRDGEHAVAAKVFLRTFHDAVVTRAPGPRDVQRIQDEIPGVVDISVVVEEGTRLSDLQHHDPYSYVLADVVVAGESEEEILAAYERCVDALGFELDETEEDDRA